MSVSAHASTDARHCRVRIHDLISVYLAGLNHHLLRDVSPCALCNFIHPQPSLHLFLQLSLRVRQPNVWTAVLYPQLTPLLRSPYSYIDDHLTFPQSNFAAISHLSSLVRVRLLGNLHTREKQASATAIQTDLQGSRVVMHLGNATPTR